MEFTEGELLLLKEALREMSGWLETDEEFQDMESICTKLGITFDD